MGWHDLFTRRKRADEIDEEIQTHLRMAIHDRADRGESPDNARAAAHRESGNVALIKENTRSVWISAGIEQFLRDMRMGARILWRSPGVSVTAVALIALIVFSSGSLIIAAVGQYASVSFDMRRRFRDFGLRVALGASSRQILNSVMREGLVLTGMGIAFGLALSLAAGTAARGLLFGVTPTDTPTYLGVLALLAIVSTIACYLPARRAAQIDPAQALRQD